MTQAEYRKYKIISNRLAPVNLLATVPSTSPNATPYHFGRQITHGSTLVRIYNIPIFKGQLYFSPNFSLKIVHIFKKSKKKCGKKRTIKFPLLQHDIRARKTEQNKSK